MSSRILLAQLSSPADDLASMLSGSSCEVKRATGAAGALRQAFSDAPPDLVLLDVARADAEAIELLRALKARTLPRFVPVLVVSRDEEVAQRVAALRAGADDFLSRPVHALEVVARVAAMLRIQASQDRLHQATTALAALSATDPLTGLHNRRHLQERLAQELSRARRYGGPLSLLLVDLDHFKRVNDGYGHQAGDAALRAVAGILRTTLRTLDVCARFGGEEFAVLMPATDWSGALTVAERLRRRIAAAPLLTAPALREPSAGPVEVRMTASLGAAFMASGAQVGADELVRAADAALYRAKQQGRDATCLAPALARPAAAASAA
ncbi:GGDEF domain-containing response regulator [Anaeromyxobacter paludicola]|uniref:diguanylate cyclase n=1 Tax=Anaeromyxobacter paludicola TaxID=2918171 RepID=A0ABM7XBC2_9BACT|nr:diguanylate cyclase [Anaeromyxobacter paludicola]BDG09148.1 diguanylate cyclase response regulator [Anaeromyxobacter paludicola]